MTWPTFANQTSAAAATIDSNLQLAGRLGAIPCTVSGTNALTLTPAPSSAVPTVSAYANYLLFSGIFAATNTTSVTFAVGGLAALNGFIDTPSGPRQFNPGDAVQNNWFAAAYDSALGSGAGGFHVHTAPMPPTGFNMPSTAAAIFLGASTSSVAIGGRMSVASISIGAAAYATRLPSSVVSVTFGAINAQGASVVSVGLTGARPLDNVLVGLPSVVSLGISYQAYVSINDTVVIIANNSTASSITPTGGLFRVSSIGFT